MCIINIIDNEEVTLVQGVGGLFLCEESWVKKNNQNTHHEKITGKGVITTNNDSDNTELSQTKLEDFP